MRILAPASRARLMANSISVGGFCDHFKIGKVFAVAIAYRTQKFVFYSIATRKFFPLFDPHMAKKVVEGSLVHGNKFHFFCKNVLQGNNASKRFIGDVAVDFLEKKKILPMLFRNGYNMVGIYRREIRYG